jgi:hypothetical protein
MRGHTVVKWQVLLEDADWDRDNCPSVPPIPAEEPIPAPISPRRRRLLWSLVGVLALAAVSGGYLLWQTAQAGLRTIETELEQAIVLEEWTAAVHPTSGGTGMQPSVSELSAPAAVDLESFDLADKIACTEVVVEDAALFSPYRETRFYRQTELGWQRTSASPSFWGAQQEFQSEHFIFLASRRDLPVAAEAALALDAIYTRLCQDLGLSPTVGEKIIVEILTDSAPQTNPFIVPNRLQVPSLALRRVPAGLSETEVLVQLVEVSLINHLLNRVAATWLKDVDWPMNWTWATLHTGMASWLTWDQESLLGQKYEEMIAWFYKEGKGVQIYTPESLPANYQEFCQICTMLGVIPKDLGIPFACASNVEFYSISYYVFPPLNMTLWDLEFPFPVTVPTTIRDAQELAEYYAQGQGLLVHSFLGKNIASFMLIDYAVETYGREKLSALIDALGTHAGWDTVIPAVYGVSVAEFEAGWRTYLQEKYASDW